MENKSNEYNNFKELIDESKSDLLSYIDSVIELAKLNFYEKLARSFSHIIYSLIMGGFVLIMFILSFICAGLFLGRLLHNYSAGFGLLILGLLFVLILMIIFRKRIRKSFVNYTLNKIKEIESDEN